MIPRVSKIFGCHRCSFPIVALSVFIFAFSPPLAQAITNSYFENFSTTTYKDAVHTTADWNTAAGKLQLFPFVPTLLGSYDTPGLATGVVISGTLAYVADGSTGLQIIDVNNPASPMLSGTYDTPGSAAGVVVSGTSAYVADGSAGLQIINVSNPASPLLLGSYDTPGTASGVAVSGTVAYVADGSSGLQIINVSDPASPTLLGSYDTPGLAAGVVVLGTVAYVADGSSGLQIISVSNPASPTLVGTFDTPGTALGLAVSGTAAYVADGSAGLQIINVSNPTSPTLIGTYDTPGSAAGVAVSGSVAYVADGSSGHQTIDVSNPASPSLVGSYDTPGSAAGVAVSGTVAYVADQGSGLQIMNASSPGNPAPLGSYDTPDAAVGVAVAGTVAYVADQASGLQIINVSNPASPTLLGTYNTAGTAVGVAVSGTLAYVADGFSGLRIINVSNPASPVLLGTYDTPDDALGVAVSGTVAYVADGFSGLQIINVNNPASPVLLGTYNTPAFARAVAVKGTVAYVADQQSGLQIINVSNPASPTLLGNYDTPGTAVGLAVAGILAYVADGSSGLQIIDVNNPASPVLLGTYDTPGTANGVAVSGTAAYVADGSSGLLCISVSNPASPGLFGTYDSPDYSFDVAVAGTVAYVADQASGLQILQMTQTARFDLGRNLGRSLAIDGASDVVMRARITSTKVDSVAWELSANGGTNWQAAIPGGGWFSLAVSGSDLRWRSTLSPVPPVATAANPSASAVAVDWLYAFPVVDSIADVRHDQGGRVRLYFTRSTYDFADVTSSPVVGYQIYHRVDDAALVKQVHADGVSRELAEPAEFPLSSFSPSMVRWLADRSFVVGAEPAAGTFPSGTWEAVGWVAATQSDSYTALIPTTDDSTATGINWSVYLITAHTTTPSIWFAGYPDSGYSVDNLAPNVPTGFVAAHQSGGGNHLAWDASADADFRYFKVYRSPSSNFTPGPSNLVLSTTSTSWADTSAAAGSVYYKLSAVDFAGNESAAASAGVTVGVDGSPAPSRFALHAAAPNPFRQGTAFSYDVPLRGGAIRLGIFDLGGRLVRSLVDGPQTPGAKWIVWDGRDDAGHALPAGMYVVRMEAPSFVQSRKLVLTR
jgi:hypothetical protein